MEDIFEKKNTITTKFLKFVEMPWGGKTKRFNVYSASTDDYLGQVLWRSGWRRYIMHFDGGCDWDCDCMTICNDFVKSLMQARETELDGKDNL
jgi:hypothetical protein